MVKNLNIRSLVIEVTRRCNLSCEHCLRGEQQDIDISLDYVEDLFKQLKSVGDITLTGGEPTMAIGKISGILEIAKEYDVDIGNFYMATNGFGDSKELVGVVIDWWLYCEDNETTAIELSNDNFHCLDNTGGQYLEALSFFRNKYSKDTLKWSSNPDAIITEGRGANVGCRQLSDEVPSLQQYEDYPEIIVEDVTIYLNCLGKIVLGCDWSYESQQHRVLCSASDDLEAELTENFPVEEY